MSRFNEANTEIRAFESITEIITECKKHEPDHPSHLAKLPWTTEKARWCGHSGLTSWDAIEDQLHSRWAHGSVIAEDMLDELRKDSADFAPKSRKRKAVLNDESGEVDIDRAWAGEELFFRESRRQNKLGPTTITLALNVSESSNVKADDLLWRCAAIVAITDILEDAGYQVEMYVYMLASRAFGNGKMNGFRSVCVKRSQDPLDFDSLVCVTSSWFFRAVVVRSLFLDPQHKVECGCGMPTNDTTVIKQIAGEDVIVLNRCTTKREALEMAREIISSIAT